MVQLIQGFGSLAPFDASEVSTAVRRALVAGGRRVHVPETDLSARTQAVVKEVVTQLHRHEFMRGHISGTRNHVMSAGELQDIVEACLVACCELAAARSYLVSRIKRDGGLD